MRLPYKWEIRSSSPHVPAEWQLLTKPHASHNFTLVQVYSNQHSMASPRTFTGPARFRPNLWQSRGFSHGKVQGEEKTGGQNPADQQKAPQVGQAIGDVLLSGGSCFEGSLLFSPS